MYQNLGKTKRILKYRNEIKEIPRQYKVNDLKEELVIRYTSERYNKQYTNLFPCNPELLLSPMNEFGQRKFISTFISPTLLPYNELYQYIDCAAFVADHVTFEPITKDYMKIPDVVSTPTMTLCTQKGDSFDISILLASLLIGAGYNAYCVCGYAKKGTCLNETSSTDFDVMNYLETKEEKPEHVEEEKERKYKAKAKVKLESRYMKLLDHIKSEKQESLHKKKEEEEGEEEEEEEEEEQERVEEEERVFCWVVLLPSSRGVETPVYINPSNGKVTPVSDPNFCKAISVWNHENYWVNMFEEHSNFDLTKENWECIFLGEEEEERKPPKKENDHDDDEEEVLDLPLTFCLPLEIPKERYETRFPNSTKTVEYRNVRIRRSAPFFEKDLSVLELSVFAGPNETSNVVLKHTGYEKRKDKLRLRLEEFDKNNNDDNKILKMEEKYAPGRKYSSTRKEGLKKIVIKHGKEEEYHFYPAARLDGLAMVKKVKDVRDPEFTRKVSFTFHDRDDFLKYRSVNYEKKKENEGVGISSSSSTSNELEATIAKKTEKFERNPVKEEADEDVEKLEYYPNRLRVTYHFGVDRITQSSKEFTRDGEVQVNLVNHYAVKPTREETLNECNELFKMDKRCTDEITRVLEELKEILELRSEDEKNIKCERSIYDYLQNDKMDEEEEHQQRETKKKGKKEGEKSKRSLKKKNDILSLHIPDGGILDKEHAIQIFDEIMDRTKSRLSMRAQIIQERLKTEKNLMNKKRLQIQKQDNENNKKEDQFLKFWEEIIFKTKILQDRCDKNIKESEEYYLKTQMSLLNDERLKDFFKDEVDVLLKDYKDVN